MRTQTEILAFRSVQRENGFDMLHSAMIDISKALKAIERETDSLGIEKVDISGTVGRVLRENIVADTDLPPFDRSQMDGFALKASNTKNAPVTLKIVGESAAGHGWHRTLKPGEAGRIMTGAPVPKGADAVQKLELASETSDGYAEIQEPTQKGRYIVKKGSEVKSGSTIFKSGEIVTENMIAVVAAFGYARLLMPSIWSRNHYISDNQRSYF